MRTSAGLLVYRFKDGQPEVFIVHNGGPYWAKKDDGVWSLPKGEIEEGDEPLATAKREFLEETGLPLPEGDIFELGKITYPKGDKEVIAWAVEGDFDISLLKSNTFEMEWPPRSGKRREFPEIDRGGWFTLQEAASKLFPPNLLFLERLASHLNVPFGSEQIPHESEQGSLF